VSHTPSNELAGYALVAVVWAVVLLPVVASLVRFVRTTRPSDLIPRIVMVRRKSGTVVRRAGRTPPSDPAEWEQVNPWMWQSRARRP